MSQITISGKCWEPEVRYGQKGTAMASVSVSVYQGKDQDQKPQYGSIKVKAFKDLAEAVGNSVDKGDNLIVVGRLIQEKWEDADGVKKYAHVIIADDIGKSIRTFGNQSGQQQPKPADAVKAFGGSQVFPPEEENVPF